MMVSGMSEGVSRRFLTTAGLLSFFCMCVSVVGFHLRSTEAPMRFWIFGAAPVLL